MLFDEVLIWKKRLKKLKSRNLESFNHFPKNIIKKPCNFPSFLGPSHFKACTTYSSSQLHRQHVPVLTILVLQVPFYVGKVHGWLSKEIIRSYWYFQISYKFPSFIPDR